MSYKAIPLEERRRLRDKKYKKHNLANILTHWFNVGMWLLLLPTGIAIISSPRLGLSPVWWQEMFRNLFGNTANLIRFHSTLGLIWTFVLTFNILLGFRRYFVPFAATRMLLDKDDLDWLRIKPLQMLGFMKGKPLPPQDAYNAGQKLYMYVVILGTIGIMASGIVMTFNTVFPPWMKQWPFAHTIEMTYRLANGELEVSTTIVNLSAEPTRASSSTFFTGLVM